MKHFYTTILILFFTSCSNYNDKMTQFINEEKNLNTQLDSINKLMKSSSFIDTFTLSQTTPEIAAKREKEDERLESLGKIYKQVKNQIKSVRFSIDSLSKMK